MDRGKVTILMATYNRAHYIVETLKSILAQTYTNWECIIVDDGGTDNTLEVITPVLENDKRFIFLKRLETYKKGLPGCRNYGLDIAQGNYIIFFDDDDIVHPQNLELCVLELEKNDIDFFHYQKQSFTTITPVFSEPKKKKVGTISVNNIENVVTNKIGLASCTILWKKECFKDIRFNSNLQYAEEWECYIKVLLKGYKGEVTEDILYYNRKHPESNTGEFYNNDPIRIQSKNDAALLVFNSLVSYNILTPFLFKYLTSIPIGFRSKKRLDKMLENSSVPLRSKVHTYTRYFAYPLWKVIKSF